MQGNEQNILLKAITDSKLEALEADTKGRHALKIAQQAEHEYAHIKQEFVSFRDFISQEIPKALKILMDGYNVAAGTTNKPCGYILERINAVVQKADNIINSFPLHLLSSTFKSTTTAAKPSWEGGFAQLNNNLTSTNNLRNSLPSSDMISVGLGSQ